MSIDSLLAEIDERTIARKIGIPHDEARMGHFIRSNTVNSFEEFDRLIGDYYNHHFTTCISNGGGLSTSYAAGRAKELLEKEYRRRGGDIVMAYNDAHDGTSSGVRGILDIIAEGLKAEAVERHIRDAFDRHVAPNSWEQKVEIIREFILRCGGYLSNSIKGNQPERYAASYFDLIRNYSEALRRTSSIFRKL